MPAALAHDDPVALGPYRLVARLGSGGMGTVYVARGAGGRTVALKTMHASVAADPAGRTRFRLEIDAARVIGGRFGAKVVDADPYAETPWLATEYVLGPPLDEAVEAAGPLPERAVRALGAALCSALGQLHRSDVVHRDLKPSNILVTAYGPKVIDFGIARAIGDDHLTRTGSAVGTPAFMSPEQATGQEHTAAGDVFALAGVLVYAARGSGAFGSGQAADLLYRVRYGEADLAGVPDALVPVLARCLSKDPVLRPTTEQLAAQLHDGGGEFADHLPDALLGDIGRRAVDVWGIVPQRAPAPAPPPDPGARPASAAGPSRRRFLSLGGGVLALGAAAGTAVWWKNRDPARGEPTGGSAVGTRNLEQLWMDSGWRETSDSAPVAAYPLGDKVVVARGIPGAAALDAASGKRVWESDPTLHSWQLTVADGTLYGLRVTDPTTSKAAANGTDCVVQRIDPKTGRARNTAARLTATNDQIVGNQLLCVADGVAYVAAGHGLTSSTDLDARTTWTLRAVDCADGRQRWSRPLPKRIVDSELLQFLSAKVVGDCLVTIEEPESGELYLAARELRDGSTRWRVSYSPGLIAPMRSSLATDATHVYIGGRRLRAVCLRDGKEDWNTPSGTRYGPPTLVSGVLYAVGENIGLAAYDAATGRKLWTEKGGTADEQARSWQPVIGKSRGYYRNRALLRAVDLSTHTVAATYQTDADRFYAVPQARRIIAAGENTLSLYPLK
ncbi:protein kinase [Streptomyces sp. VRA16 Mangrove soil]|uniref:serine/threonine-protein kinase n=1 Tax=Streptomyces sp. VRA16 Mangrove soil TaxID=2817434 RepID=UPI001A9FEB9A|nr:serine/threonine-protein kinase [Streptomyces sp. VRA16 Mangrove soil]MBO1336050.1 protein kinase [Streptomyces sp. VRA16 Mangrove soil]